MLEIEEMSERSLPPELIRRLQVEELWARRKVLAEWMNALLCLIGSSEASTASQLRLTASWACFTSWGTL